MLSNTVWPKKTHTFYSHQNYACRILQITGAPTPPRSMQGLQKMKIHIAWILHISLPLTTYQHMPSYTNYVNHTASLVTDDNPSFLAGEPPRPINSRVWLEIGYSTTNSMVPHHCPIPMFRHTHIIFEEISSIHILMSANKLQHLLSCKSPNQQKRPWTWNSYQPHRLQGIEQRFPPVQVGVHTLFWKIESASNFKGFE